MNLINLGPTAAFAVSQNIILMVTAGRVVRYDLEKKACSPLLQVDFCEIRSVFCLSDNILVAEVFESDRFFIQSSRMLFLKAHDSFSAPVGHSYRFDSHLEPVTQRGRVSYFVGKYLCRYEERSGPFAWRDRIYYMTENRQIVEIRVRRGRIEQTPITAIPSSVASLSVRGDYIDYRLISGSVRGIYSLQLRKVLVSSVSTSKRFESMQNIGKSKLILVNEGNSASRWQLGKEIGRLVGSVCYLREIGQSCWIIVTTEGEVLKLQIKPVNQKRIFKNWLLQKKIL